jgi:glycosyltransferase involved in cell wall biosynthesis
MRIVFDVSYIQKRHAGVGRYAAELLTALLDADSSNEYVLHGWSFSLDREKISRFQQANVLLRTARIPGPVKRAYWKILQFPSVDRLIGDFDLFHSCDPFIPPVGQRSGIATVHDLAWKRVPRFFQRSVLREAKYIEDSLNRAAAIVADSHQTMNDLLETFRLPPEKIHVVWPPVSVMFRREPDADLDRRIQEKYGLELPFVLFVGTMEPRKNVVSVIRAFELVHQAYKNALQLVLVGKRGWMYREIFETIRRSAVANRIRYLEYLPDNELASVYRLAHLFVYVSFYEGFGFPVLEAMACGTPVITSDCSSLREIAGDAAVLIDPQNVEALAAAMTAAMADTAKREQLVNAGLAKAKEYSGQRSAGTMLKLYQSLKK